MAERELQSAKITLTIDDAQLRESMRRMRDESRETKATKGSDRTAGSTVDLSKMSRSQFDLLKINEGAEPGVEVTKIGKKIEDEKKRRKKEAREEARRVAAEVKRTSQTRRKRNRAALAILKRTARGVTLAVALDEATKLGQAAGSDPVSNVVQGGILAVQQLVNRVAATAEAGGDVVGLGAAMSFADRPGRVDEIHASAMFQKRQDDHTLERNMRTFMNKVESVEVRKAALEMATNPSLSAGLGEYLSDKTESVKETGTKAAQSALSQFANWIGFTNPAGGQWR